jgi:hypothetical protein
MIEGLESRYRVEECSFNTIFGSYQGHRIFASRKVAEKIEKQTRYAAELYESSTSAGLLLIFELSRSVSHSPRPFPALIFSKPAMLNYGLRFISLRLPTTQVLQCPGSPK